MSKITRRLVALENREEQKSVTAALDSEVGELEELETTDDMVCADAEIKVVSEEVNEVQEVQASLEAYATLLKQAGPKGISRQAAAFMAVDMKRIDKVLGTPSLGLEAFNATPQHAAQNTTVSLESIGEKIKAAGKAALAKFLELWNKLVEKAQMFSEKLKSGAAKMDTVMQQTEDKLQEAVQSATGNDVVGKPYMMDANGIYYIKGEFAAHNPDSIKPLVQFAAVDYPKAALAAFQEINTAIKAFKPGNGTDGFAAAVDQALQRITALEGNAAVGGSYPDGMSIGQTGRYVFSVINDEHHVEVTEEVEVKLEAVQAMRVRYGKLEKMQDLLNGAWETDQAMRDQWNAAAATLKELGGNQAVSDEDYQNILTIMSGRVQQSMPDYPLMCKLIIRVLTAWSFLVGYELDQHGRMMEDMSKFAADE